MSACRLVFALLIAVAVGAVLLCVPAGAQGPGLVAGPNIDMVASTKTKASDMKFPEDDIFLNAQNEPAVAPSTRNLLTLVGGANDYRAVDFPGLTALDDDAEVRDVWQGLYKSFDGGFTWQSTLLPGCPFKLNGVPLPACQTLPGDGIHGQFDAAADPSVVAGSNGQFYYSFIAFNRGDKKLGAVAVARFIDNNNDKQSFDRVAYLGNTIVDAGTPGKFIDKPSLAVDIPRAGAMTSTFVVPDNAETFEPGKSAAVAASVAASTIQTLPCGNIYVGYSNFLGSDANPSSQIRVATSADCGLTFTNVKVSESSHLNQGSSLAVDPRVSGTDAGAVYVAWRRLADTGASDAILFAKLSSDGRQVLKAVEVKTFAPGVLFDQPRTPGSFRVKAFPSIAVDANGIIYIFWSQRGLAKDLVTNQPTNDARIVVSTSTDGGTTWSPPTPINPIPATSYNPSGRGHQFMPAAAFSAGDLMVSFFDSRDDHTRGQYTLIRDPVTGKASYVETSRRGIGSLDPACIPPAGVSKCSDLVYTDFITDATPGLKFRHTIAVRAVRLTPGAMPLANASVRISKYRFGTRPGSKIIEDLEDNPPNLQMFAGGHFPFIGDYVGMGTLTMVKDTSGKDPRAPNGWRFNTDPSDNAVFYTVWGDNRRVRPPRDKDWTHFTPVGSTGGPSLFDPTVVRPVCMPGQAGARNQEIFVDRLDRGLFAAGVTNSKPLNLTDPKTGQPLPRTFALFVQNTTSIARSFRLTIGQPLLSSGAPDPSAFVSFLQSSPLGQLDISVPGKSAASRLVFFTSSDPHASVMVNVSEITMPGGTLVPGGLQSSIVLNADATNPDPVDPVTGLPLGFETYDPDISKPQAADADIVNGLVTSPTIADADIVDADIVDADIVDADIVDADIVDADIVDGDIVDGDIVDADIVTPDPTLPLRDATFNVANTGNTSGSFNAKLFLKRRVAQCPALCGQAGQPLCPKGCVKLQMVLRKRNLKLMPGSGASACQLQVQAQNVTVSNITNPNFTTAAHLADADIVVPDSVNVALPTGGNVKLTLRYTRPSPGTTSSPLMSAAAESLDGGAGSPFDPIDQVIPGDPIVSGVTSVVGAQAPDTGQTTPSLTLTIISTNVENTPPDGFVGVPYNFATSDATAYALQAIGGVTPYCWTTATSIALGVVLPCPSFATGLPPGLALNAATGKITGVPTTKGDFAFIAQVSDAAPTLHSNTQDLTIHVNQLLIQPGQLAISGMTAFQQGIAGDTVVKAGEFITVQVSILNDGTATAPNVTTGPLILSRTGTALEGSCTLGAPPGGAPGAAATFASNETKVYTYTCGPVSGDGVLGFSLNNGAAVQGFFTGTAAGAANSILVDSTPPVITGSRAPLANQFGWNNTDVMVSFGCVDNPGAPLVQPSGVSTFSGPTTLTAEGMNQSVNGNCADVAGNISMTSVSGINIDKTSPTVVVTTPAHGAVFGLNAVVAASYGCGDALSGLSTCVGPVPNTSNISTSPAGAKMFSVNATDIAGNPASLTNNYTVATVAFTTQPSNAQPGSTISAVQVALRDALNNTILASGVPITLAIGNNPGGGTLSGTKTKNTDASGVATFSDLSIDKTGSGYTLTASLSGVTLATSNPFDILVPGAGSITTIAGTTWTFPLAGGPATTIPLGFTEGMAFNAATGDLYVADNGNHIVVKISSNGTLSVVAGTGVAGFFGDGGQATSAMLNNPLGIALDSAGNLYIADNGNQRIRKVSTAGIITTVAGNGIAGFNGDGIAATSANLNGPNDVALDSAGNIYITDTNNSRVRKVDTSGLISTVAGTGVAGFSGDGGLATAAQLNFPEGLAVNGPDLYVSDTNNQRVRKISAGNITTVAGNGFFGFSGDGAAATAAMLRTPQGISVDPAGNLYITDHFSNRIRKVDTGGIITTVAGTGGQGFSGDGGLATAAALDFPTAVRRDAAGNLYIADSLNKRVRKVDLAGNINTIAGNGLFKFNGDGGTATSALLSNPFGVALDGSGNVYIGDRNNFRIRKVSGGTISTIAGTGVAGYSGDGGPATTAAVGSFVVDVATDSFASVYIADRDNARVRKVSGGNINTVAGDGVNAYSGDGGLATAASLFGARHAVVDPAGNIYVAQENDSRIRKVSPSGVITTIAGNGTFGFSGDGGPATAAQLSAPRGMAVDSAGNLYVADQGNNRIRMISPGGIITTVAGDGTPGVLNGPNGVAVDAGGNLYVSDTNNNRIRKVSLSGVITTIAGTGAAGFSGDGGPATSATMNRPRGIALDTSANVYFADSNNDRIRKVLAQGAPPSPASRLTITTTSIATGTFGVAYGPVALSFTGGSGGAVTWSITDGALPTGVTLSAGGALSGTPGATGSFSFTVQAAQAGGGIALARFTLQMNLPAGAQLVFVTQPSTANATQPIPSFQVRAQTAAAVPIPGVPVTLSIGTNPAGAGLSGTTTAVTGATGLATFSNVSINKAASGYTLVASVLNARPFGAVEVIAPPPSVQFNALESDTLARFFTEKLGFTLPSAVTANITSPGTYKDPAVLSPGIIAAGSVVDSYYLHADPIGAAAISRFQSGSITFSTDILGVIDLSPQQAASDGLLGATGTVYPFGGCPVDPGNPQDALVVSADKRTLFFNLANSTGCDAARIITASASALITPATSTIFNILPAVTIGMVANSSNGKVVVFSPDTDTATASVTLTGATIGTAGDCAISPDRSLGFVTDFASHIFAINLVGTPALASGTNPIPISNQGEDLSLSADGSFLLACDGSIVQPVSVVTVAMRSQTSTLATGSDCNSVDVASDGSVLVTSSNAGNVRRLTLSGAGVLTNTGEVLSAGGEPNNAIAAPGGASGVVITRVASSVTSFKIPGLTAVSTRSLSGFGISGVFSPSGDKLYVRTNGGVVNVFSYDLATGAIGASPLFSIASATAPTFFGMDQMAIHPDGSKLYVSQSGGACGVGVQCLAVFNATTGALMKTITHPDISGPTGVCIR